MRDDIGDYVIYDDMTDDWDDTDGESMIERIITLIANEYDCGTVEAYEIYESLDAATIRELLAEDETAPFQFRRAE